MFDSKFALFAVFALLAATQAETGGGDPRIGSWTLIAAQSSLNPPDRLSVTDLHGVIHVVMAGQTHLDFTAKPGGHDTAVADNPAFNQVELRRIDKHQAEVIEKKDGAIVATVREKLSSSGNELTVVTASEGHAEQITIWARSGTGKAAGNLLAGEWTQDISKTRLRQGLQLKIAPDGNGGVRFAGDFSYTARFDGKQYDLHNSRNDTVSLTLIDHHTVDAIYRRGDQPTQKEQWQLSEDGQQLTVTTAGTLETGQKLSEKLTFKKQ